jgi:hypothetical protein
LQEEAQEALINEAAETQELNPEWVAAVQEIVLLRAERLILAEAREVVKTKDP